MSTAPSTGTPVSASCSFCQKPSSDVAAPVAGPGVYICDKPECLAPESQLPVWEQVAGVEEVLASWAQIGASLGIARQSAWERYHGTSNDSHS